MDRTRSITHSTSSLLFDRRRFGAYWFETGTPTFLIETLIARGVNALRLDDMLGSDELLSAFDVDHIATEALLFQTGYLTIRQTELRGNRTYYRLGYPNQEVRQSLNESLLNRLTKSPAQQVEYSARLYDLLLVNDFVGLEDLFKAFFASIPYQWHTKNDIADYEGYYASVFYSYFASVGLDIAVEDSSSHGAFGHGGVLQRQHLFVRVQSGRIGVRGGRDGATQREMLRGQVPRLEPTDSSRRRRVQPRDPQCGGIRGCPRIRRRNGLSSQRIRGWARCRDSLSWARTDRRPLS